MTEQPQADWPPRSSAWQLPEGTKRYSSTGQLWRVESGRWLRIPEPATIRQPDIGVRPSAGA